MSNHTWDHLFLSLFDRSVARYRAGDADLARYFDAGDLAFLASIGCKTREFFDFVEDFVDRGDPSPSTALLVAAVRRDYFIHVQKWTSSNRVVEADDLPSKDAEMEGIPWLPRILKKARHKLRGENCPDIMYGCGGDRRFLARHDIHPADFLRVVWAAGDNDARVLEFVRSRV